MLRIRVFVFLALLFSTIHAPPCGADPWGAVSARHYASLGTGIYSAPDVIPAPGPEAGAARIVTSPNLGLNYGFGIDFPLGARSLLGFDFRIHSFGSEPYNPRNMLSITLGLGMNLGG